MTERCVVQLKAEKAQQRLQHWRKISQHAAEQSGRTVLPELLEIKPIQDWVSHQNGLKIFLDPYAEQTLAELKPDTMQVTLLTGPEGGFTDQERSLAKAAGFILYAWVAEYCGQKPPSLRPYPPCRCCGGTLRSEDGRPMTDDRNPKESLDSSINKTGLSTDKPSPEGEAWVRGSELKEESDINSPHPSLPPGVEGVSTAKSKASSSGFSFLYALVPLLVLLAATFFACILAYVMVSVWPEGPSFRTIVKKSSQIFLVLSIFPLMHYLKISRFDLGLAPKAAFFKQLWQGVGLGFVTLMPVFIALYLLGINVIDESKPWAIAWVSSKLAGELLLALLISLFEEPVFRGILLAGLCKRFSTVAAIAISAFYYASLHFLDTKTQIPLTEIHLFSGFSLLGEAFGNLLNPKISSAFLALLMVGIFLGVLRTQINASLGLCIGCHACWVWLIKLNKICFNTNPQSDYLFLVSSYDGVIGPLVTAWLAMALFGYYVYRRKKLNTNSRTTL